MDADFDTAELYEPLADAKLEQRVDSIEQRLAALAQVPQQLSRVLELLTSLQTALSELAAGPARAGLNAAAVPLGLARLRPQQAQGGGLARSATGSDTLTSDSSADLSSRKLPLIGQPASFAVADDSCNDLSAPPMRRSSTVSDDPSMSQVYRQRRTSVRSNNSSDPSVGMKGPPPWRRLPSKARAAAPRRPSTCSSRSAAPRSASAVKTLEAVVPHSVPSPRSAQDMDAARVSTRDNEPLTCTRTVPEGDGEASTSLANEEENRKLSVNTNLSLGDNRPTIDRGLSSIALFDLESEIKSRQRQTRVLLPNALPRLCWDFLMVVITVLVGLFVPVDLIYLDEASSVSRALLQFASVAWILDIALNFRTGFFRAGKVVQCPWLIAKRYACTWLLVDVLSAWPPFLAPPGAAAARAFAALKLLRLLRLGPLLAGLQKEHHCIGLPVRVGLMVLLTTHATTCLWRVSLHLDAAGGGGAAAAAQWREVYIEDAYWVMMTMTTVGFGDIHPVGTNSRVCAILAMLVAPLFFGVIVSLLTHVTKGIFNDEVDAQVAEVARFMRHRRMPHELQRRVEHNLRYNIREERLMTLAPGLFSKLSPAVQGEVSLELLRSTVLNFPLFRDVLHSFIAELAQAHTWVKCVPGDLVVEEGQLMQEVVFVIRGRLLIQSTLQEVEEPGAPGEAEALPGVREVDACAGAWFGEAALFFDDRVRTDTAFAASASELAVLAGCDYHRVVRKYPRLWKRHQSIEQALRSGSLSLKEIAYKKPSEEAAIEHWQLYVWPPQGLGSWWRTCRHSFSGTLRGPRL